MPYAYLVSELGRVEIRVLLKQVIIHLLYVVVMWINTSPNANGINQLYSLREIITGKTLEYDLHCKANLGQHTHAHMYPEKTNGTQKHTFPRIYSGPTGNMQSTVKVLHINTRNVKKPKTFTEALTPVSVVELVNDWGKKKEIIID